MRLQAAFGKGLESDSSLQHEGDEEEAKKQTGRKVKIVNKIKLGNRTECEQTAVLLSTLFLFVRFNPCRPDHKHRRILKYHIITENKNSLTFLPECRNKSNASES